MEPKPAVRYKWQSLQDGGGRFIPQIINEKEASALELKEMKNDLIRIKQMMKHDLLLALLREGRTTSWKERWRVGTSDSPISLS